jgi:SAM-dependent methyltransferase
MDPINRHKRKLGDVISYFDDKVTQHGATAKGLDYNSEKAQEVRFDQLLKLVDPRKPFSVNDYGCGFGSLAFYMRRLGYQFTYSGFDISTAMIDAAHEQNPKGSGWVFTTNLADLKPADYTIACGIFNLRFKTGDEEWLTYILETIENFAELSTKGFAFNMLTMYSDPDKMRPDLYYGDPAFFFDHCKRKYSRNVALLHDYELYDFTILVRL